ncbi:MAG: hypothetical protein QM504_08435 [Pseudomonadota bacterium]
MAPQVDPMPPYPSRGESSVDYADKADDWTAAFPTASIQINVVSDFCETKASECEVDAIAAAISALDAETSANQASSSANFAGEWSTLTGSLSVPVSVYHNNQYWMLLNNLADVTLSEPSHANSDWAIIVSGFFIIETAVSKTITNQEHSAVTAATQTITLPASPVVDFRCKISVDDFNDTEVNGNGKKIMGSLGNLTMNVKNSTLSLTFQSESFGWRIV